MEIILTANISLNAYITFKYKHWKIIMKRFNFNWIKWPKYKLTQTLDIFNECSALLGFSELNSEFGKGFMEASQAAPFNIRPFQAHIYIKKK